MASLSTQTFIGITQGIVAAIQAGATALLNLSIGSVLRAIVEAIAGVVLWLQGLVVYVLTLTRFATSTGSDADSWAADYGFERLGATPSTGQVTFSRFTTTNQAVVPVGTLLQTADGSETFTVPADTTNVAYNPALNGFVMAATVASVTVEVECTTPGSGGNVLANTITSIGGSGVPGVDTVTNADAFTNGADAETDAAFKTRFVLYIAGLSKATAAAIESAIANVQQGIQYTLTEDYDYNGTYDPGYFYAVIDDGSGSPPSQLLTNVGNAIEAVRALGIRYGVFAPIVDDVNISMTLTTASGFTHSTVVGEVGLALTAYVNGLGLGNGLPYARLAGVAFGVAGVTNVSAILLNSGTSDIAASPKITLKSGTISVA